MRFPQTSFALLLAGALMGVAGGAPSAVSCPVWICKMRVDARPAPGGH
ncbi:hypothetical protein [Methylocella sp.]